MIAVSSDAPTLAPTICGCPGKATTVDTTTIGLIAGAASMNVRAAAPSAPSPNSRRASGTDPHSHPGRAAPLAAAATTATEGRRGSHRDSRSGVTNVASSALSSTPSARKGKACTKIPAKTVPAVERSVLSYTASRRVVPNTAKATITAATTQTGAGRASRAPRFGAVTRSVCQSRALLRG